MSKFGIRTEYVNPESLRQRVEKNLAVHARRSVSPSHLRPAAVAVAIVMNSAGQECFVLIRRAPMLRDHAGQWALPGGSIDAGESAIRAALRELREEVGVFAHEDNVLGLLDDYPTRSGFVITPVVVWCGDVGDFATNAAEVAEAHRVPLTELTKQGVPRLRKIPESERPVISIRLIGTDVHAPTAAVLYQFREVGLLARSTRVDQYDQPVFAWK